MCERFRLYGNGQWDGQVHDFIKKTEKKMSQNIYRPD